MKPNESQAIDMTIAAMSKPHSGYGYCTACGHEKTHRPDPQVMFWTCPYCDDDTEPGFIKFDGQTGELLPKGEQS